jgi:tRNA(His) guanylyltransferase
MTDTLGDRIKRYERTFKYQLSPKTPLFIRVDGKAFHTFTKGLDRPFDQRIVNAMVYAATMTAEEMSGFKLGYVQSDEATFMLTDTDNFETQGWFDHELNKIVSVSASAFTAHFNWYWHIREDMPHSTAMFDSRAFTVPVEDAPNVFIWRQRDWERNSIQMFARAHFTHKECEGKKMPDLHEMLHEKGLNWTKDLTEQLKNGTFIEKDGTLSFNKEDYESIRSRLNVEI